MAGGDALSYTETNTNVEDSDEEGDCKHILYLSHFLVIEYEIKLKFDEDGVLSYQPLVRIFDKRQVIKGIKKMKYDFKVKRRRLFVANNLVQYKKIVLLYKKAIESKIEDNLRFVGRKVSPLSIIDQIIAWFKNRTD
jgi:hypothetical protein